MRKDDSVERRHLPGATGALDGGGGGGAASSERLRFLFPP
jgi:hypothetical protein